MMLRSDRRRKALILANARKKEVKKIFRPRFIQKGVKRRAKKSK